MSAALYIVLEDGEPGFETQVGGKALAREEDSLNAIARSLKVMPLMEFFSFDTEEAIELMEFEGDPSKADIPETQWFDAADGLKTVQTLLSYITSHPDSVGNTQAVIEDLTEFEEVLEQAQENGLTWHLSVDY
jgi:hypothetical protein